MARTTPTPTLQLHQNKLLFTVSSSLHRYGNANRLPFTSVFFTSNLSHSFTFINKHLYVSLPSLSSSSATRVSTVPVEHAPDFDFHQEISRLKTLRLALSGSEALDEKLRLLCTDSRVNQFFSYQHTKHELYRITDLGKYDLYLIKCLVAAGQGHVISSGLQLSADDEKNNWVESDKGSLKTAFHSLAEMIERWDGVNGMEGGSDKKKREDQLSALKELLKILADVEQFYDCIGGIIG